MKRIITTFCLLVGASVASYAGLITSTAGFSGSSTLQSFDSGVVGTFPLASLAALPVGNGVTVTVTSSGPGANGLPNDASSFNTGSNGSLRDNIPGFASTDKLISTQAFGDASLPGTFARNITFTFSAPISEFLIDYYGNDSGNNYFILNTNGTIYSMGNSVDGQIGANDGNISSVTFVIYGNDSTFGTLGGANGGDRVRFNDLQVVTTGGVVDGGGDDGGGAIPEPSTYALMGAGLMALAYARRKK